jgi:rubredoxin
MSNIATENESAAHSASTDFRSWLCVVCGLVYSEADGMPEHGIPVGTLWAEVPSDWVCPDCGCTKSDFEMVEI